jgi:hypothetical protein
MCRWPHRMWSSDPGKTANLHDPAFRVSGDHRRSGELKGGNVGSHSMRTDGTATAALLPGSMHRIVPGGSGLPRRARSLCPVQRRRTGLEYGQHSLHNWKGLLKYGSRYLHSHKKVCPQFIAAWWAKRLSRTSFVEALMTLPYIPSVHREGRVGKTSAWPRTRVGRNTRRHIAAMRLIPPPEWRPRGTTVRK